MKTCITCSETKDLTDFHKCSGSESRRSECKKCANDRNKKNYKKVDLSQRSVLKKDEVNQLLTSRTKEVLQEIDKTRAFYLEKGEEEKSHALMLCKLNITRKFLL